MMSKNEVNIKKSTCITEIILDNQNISKAYMFFPIY